jgi:hypothetical protein
MRLGLDPIGRAIRNRDPSALRAQLFDDGLPDPPGRAGDESVFVLKHV